MTHLAIYLELPGNAPETDVAQNRQNYDNAFTIPAISFARVVAFAIGRPEEGRSNETLVLPARHELKLCQISLIKPLRKRQVGGS